GDTLRLVAALGIHDGDMHTLLRQRMTDALPEPAIAARHQCHRAREVHEFSPLHAGERLSRALPRVRGQFATWPEGRQAVARPAHGEDRRQASTITAYPGPGQTHRILID